MGKAEQESGEKSNVKRKDSCKKRTVTIYHDSKKVSSKRGKKKKQMCGKALE